jgi:hypothetical protein
MLSWNLAEGDAVLLLAAGAAMRGERLAGTLFARLRRGERARRARFTSRLERAADAYLVRRGDGKTIVAGYPWFTGWGLTRSLRFGVSVSLLNGWVRRARFCSSGRGWFRRECCPTASWIREDP